MQIWYIYQIQIKHLCCLGILEKKVNISLQVYGASNAFHILKRFCNILEKSKFTKVKYKISKIHKEQG